LRPLNESPIDHFLAAIDKLDVEAAIALMAPDCRMLIADGRRAEDTASVRELISDLLATLHETTHRVTSQWHPEDDVWIAEIEATYELKDRLRISVPRAFVLRDGPHGIVGLNVYGAHEHPLTEHRTGAEGMRLGGRWIPPL
jgi:hypothetical protein